MKKQLCLIGNPVSHSLSAVMQNFISDRMNLPYEYSLVEVAPGMLSSTIKQFVDGGMCGFNITYPYKLDILEYVDTLSDQAAIIGSVNTIKNNNGNFVGYNTDGEGFVSSLIYEGIDVGGKDIVLYGAGGSCRSISVALTMHGAKCLTIVSRSQDGAQSVCENVNKKVRDCTKFVLMGQESEHLPKCDIVINTTPLGMHGDTEGMTPLWDFSALRSDCMACDLIYNPPATKFLQLAQQRGLKTVNGLGMLIFQAFLSYEIWTGHRPHDSIAVELMQYLNGVQRA